LTKCVLSVPILTPNKQSLGVAQVISRNQEAQFTESDVSIFEVTLLFQAKFNLITQ